MQISIFYLPICLSNFFSSSSPYFQLQFGDISLAYALLLLLSRTLLQSAPSLSLLLLQRSFWPSFRRNGSCVQSDVEQRGSTFSNILECSQMTLDSLSSMVHQDHTCMLCPDRTLDLTRLQFYIPFALYLQALSQLRRVKRRHLPKKKFSDFPDFPS